MAEKEIATRTSSISGYLAIFLSLHRGISLCDDDFPLKLPFS